MVENGGDHLRIVGPDQVEGVPGFPSPQLPLGEREGDVKDLAVGIRVAEASQSFDHGIRVTGTGRFRNPGGAAVGRGS
jgi:hypothetical protein